MPVNFNRRTGREYSGESGKRLEAARAKAMLTNPENLKTDEQKYAAANELAKQDLSGQSGITRGQYKEAIDKRLGELGSSKSGREIRGDNYWTDFVTGVNDAIDTVNTGIGNAVDWTFDNTVGNLAGLVNDDAGEAVKNFANGSDLAFIPDMASDVLLATVGGVPGLLAVLGKEAFRSSDTLGKAITGKDAITQENLDAGERWANAGLGTLGLALAAIPGAGKAKNIAAMASDKGAKKTAETAAKGFADANEKFLDDSTKSALEKLGITIDENGKIDAKAMDEAAKASKKAYEQNKSVYDTATKNLEDGGLDPYYPNVQWSPNREWNQFVKEESEKRLKDLEPQQEVFKTYSEVVKPLEELDEYAKNFENMGTFERALEILRQDRQGLADAWGRRGETIQAARDQQQARRDLIKLLREANKDMGKNVEEIPYKSVRGADKTRKQKSIKTKESKDGQIGYEEILKNHVKTEEGQTAEDALAKLFDDAGANIDKLKIGRITGKFKAPLREAIMPHPLQPLGALRRDLGVSSNSALRYANELAGNDAEKLTAKAINRFVDKYDKDKAGEADKKFRQWLDDYRLDLALNPSGKAYLAKDIAGRAGAATIGGTLASAANGGSANPVGAAADAVAYANEGIENGQTRAGTYLAALMPFLTGKRYAYSALPGITGKLASYHPYGAIYAKDVMHSMADDEREQPRATSLANVYENMARR